MKSIADFDHSAPLDRSPVCAMRFVVAISRSICTKVFVARSITSAPDQPAATPKPQPNPANEERFPMRAGSKAHSAMYTYEAVILVIGLVIAGVYTFMLKPGETGDQPAVEAINPNRCFREAVGATTFNCFYT